MNGYRDAMISYWLRYRTGFLLLAALFSTGVCVGGCKAGEDADRHVSLDRLNVTVIDGLFEGVYERGGLDFEPFRFDKITATRFIQSATIRIEGERQSVSGTKIAGSYDVACSVDNGILRARIVASTLPGVDLKDGANRSGTVSRFEEAVSRALTTDAMSGVADAGIRSVAVENNALLIEAVAPMR